MSCHANLNRQLADNLARRGDELAEQHHIDDALSVYFQSLSLRSNNPALLRKIAELYLRADQPKAAQLCQLGVIPDAANERYFDATGLAHKIISIDSSLATETLRVTAAENVPLEPPVAHGRVGKYNQFNRHQTDCRGTLLTVTTGGEVWFDGVNTLVIDRERNILTEHSKGNELLAWRAAASKPPTHLAGRVCFIDARSSAIYYHWMLDVLPKLSIVEQAGITYESIDKFVVRATSGFQLATLQQLGIPADKIYFEDGGMHISADEVVVPLLKNDLGDRIYTGLGLGLASWVPIYLKEQFIDAQEESAPRRGGRKLYITRSNAKSRRLLNEQELSPLLTEFGFETCEFESMSVQEQAQIMTEADYIVAPHGAGLTNLVFCNPGTRLLEIFGDYIVPCYWSLANLVGMEYHYYMAEPVNERVAPGHTTRGQVAQRRAKDLVVDIESFTKALQTICR